MKFLPLLTSLSLFIFSLKCFYGNTIATANFYNSRARDSVGRSTSTVCVVKVFSLPFLYYLGNFQTIFFRRKRSIKSWRTADTISCRQPFRINCWPSYIISCFHYFHDTHRTLRSATSPYAQPVRTRTEFSVAAADHERGVCSAI